jgi:competence protein ComEC
LPHLPHWLSYRVPSPPEWAAWGFAISIVIAAWALGRLQWAAWSALAAAAVFAALISVYPFRPRLPSGEVEITVLDCGGGGATFVVLPDRTTMLVGAGGGRSSSRRQDVFQRRRWDAGEEIVSPYLWSRGIKKIDILVVSSDRARQLGGFDAVVANFRVGEVWHGPEPSSEGRDPAPDYEALLDRLRARGVSEREVAAGESLAAGGARVQVLSPNTALARVVDPGARRQTRSRSSQSDDSLVLRISSGEASVLLAGDIGERAERQLASSATPLGSQVLEVARLGARSSSTAEFLTRVAPRIAILTADRDDPKRSPGPETLDVGRRLFRTDRDGAVTVEMRGGSLAASGFVEGR